ncbi:hypothetical protein [Streptomyces sp. NPDC013455]|uniref:hypothetical protein n=1 Tax=Streptomyces sp. NPDC013455 TaxID=3155605 RepID=UPI0033CD824F
MTHIMLRFCQQSGRRLVQGARERDRSIAMKHRIVVLGAGYAGAFAAGNLLPT